MYAHLRTWAARNPRSITLVSFSAQKSCPMTRELKARIASAAGCSASGFPCIEGSDAEYRAAIGEP